MRRSVDAYLRLSRAAWWLVENRRSADPRLVAWAELERDAARAALRATRAAGERQ
ncbi:MAG TPA: hypothetical protein VH062_02490 [Polyangiaceae bacterium]|nr:hypothetical protein [Polyangiaceae bacterium]